MAGGLAQVYQMVVYRRMEHRGWSFATPQSADARMQAFRNAVLCNMNNDQRGHRRQWVASMTQDHQKVALTDGK